MDNPFVLVEDQDNLRVLTLNRPDKLNSLSADMLDALEASFTHLPTSVRGVLLQGAGARALAAGADIRAFPAMDTREKGEAFARKGQAIFDKVEQCHVPVVVLIQGYAIGGGSELAMAAHARIASPEAQFAQPEIDLGIIPGYGGTVRMARLVGHAKALEWMLSAKRIDAEEALQTGLVNAIVPKEQLLQTGLKWLADWAKKPARAVEALLRCFQDHPTYEQEARLFGECCATADFQEGVQAFLNKRPPNFKGK